MLNGITEAECICDNFNSLYVRYMLLLTRMHNEADVHYMEGNIIGHNKVVQLASLCAVYVDALEKSGSPNSDYRGEKILIRIRNDPQFNNRITKRVPSCTGRPSCTIASQPMIFSLRSLSGSSTSSWLVMLW